jgi:hypothetical protein
VVVETPIAFTTAESVKRIRDQSNGIMERRTTTTASKVVRGEDGRYILREEEEDEDEKEENEEEKREHMELAKHRIQILDELWCRWPKESEQLLRMFLDWQKQRLASRRLLILSGGVSMCMETDLTCGLASGKQYVMSSLTSVPTKRLLPVAMEGVVGIVEQNDNSSSEDEDEDDEKKKRRGPITFKHRRYRMFIYVHSYTHNTHTQKNIINSPNTSNVGTKRTERRYCVGVAEVWAQPGTRDFTGPATVLAWTRRPAIDIDMALHFKQIPVHEGFLTATQAANMGFWKYLEHASRQHYWWRDRMFGPGRDISKHALARVAEWIDGAGVDDNSSSIDNKKKKNDEEEKETFNVRRALASSFWKRRVREQFEIVTSRRAKLELSDCVRRIWRGLGGMSQTPILRPVVLASPNLDDDFVMDLASQRLEEKRKVNDMEWDFRTFQRACEDLIIECVTLRASDFAVDFERARAAERARRKEKARLERERKERIRAEKKARRDERRKAKAERARLKREAEEKAKEKARASFRKIRKRSTRT